MLTHKITVSQSGPYTGGGDLSQPVDSLSYQWWTELADGTAAGQANARVTDRRTLAGSATENLDLSGGLTDPFGAPLLFTAVKAIQVSAAAANAGAITIGGAASNAFVGPFGASTHTLSVPPGATVLLVHPGAGWPVTAGTADLLKVANGSASASVYDVIIVGVE